MAAPASREVLGIVAGGRDTRPLPEKGFIRLRAVSNTTVGLVAELDGPVTASGYATHDVVSRPRREGIATYAGRAPLTLRIPLLLDRDLARGSVEPEIKMLERMLAVGEDKPPRLIIEGYGVPHGHQRNPKLRWELTGDPEWGDDVRHRDDGNRTRISVTVTAIRIDQPSSLTQPNEGELVAVRDHYKVPKNGHPRSLKGIAKKFDTPWRKLRKLNPKLPGDPDKGLPAGTKVRVQ